MWIARTGLVVDRFTAEVMRNKHLVVRGCLFLWIWALRLIAFPFGVIAAVSAGAFQVLNIAIEDAITCDRLMESVASEPSLLPADLYEEGTLRELRAFARMRNIDTATLRRHRQAGDRLSRRDDYARALRAVCDD